jgi:hypothetical protein
LIKQAYRGGNAWCEVCCGHRWQAAFEQRFNAMWACVMFARGVPVCER